MTSSFHGDKTSTKDSHDNVSSCSVDSVARNCAIDISPGVPDDVPEKTESDGAHETASEMQSLLDSENPKTDGKTKKKVKERHKKNGAKGSGSSSSLKEKEHQDGRLGKKRLRKMRFQKQSLSKTEFLVMSANNFSYTGSVNLMTTNLTSSTGIEPTTEKDGLPITKESGQTLVKLTTSTGVENVTRAQQDSFPEMVNVQVQPLLVLDLNGILCHRIRHNRETVENPVYRPLAAKGVAGTPIIPRTDLDEFLYFLDQHFCLAVWTSAKSKTASQLIQLLIPEPVRNRLLFVWAQHNCDVHKDADDGLPLFEKNMAKVWKEYPLWNANNTLLIDDSPEKCAQWHENAVHPPPLHGRVLGVDESLLTDEENALRQRDFFGQLVQFWLEHPLIQDLYAEEEAGDAIFSCTKMQIDFLRESAIHHMGWTPRGSAVST